MCHMAEPVNIDIATGGVLCTANCRCKLYKDKHIKALKVLLTAALGYVEQSGGFDLAVEIRQAIGMAPQEGKRNE